MDALHLAVALARPRDARPSGRRIRLGARRWLVHRLGEGVAGMAAKGRGTTRLSQMLYLWRTLNHLSLRDAETEIGVSSATLMRIEHGHACDVETWLKIQAWLFAAIGPAPRSRPAPPQEQTS